MFAARIIAVRQPDHLPHLPDVPTMSEQGAFGPCVRLVQLAASPELLNDMVEKVDKDVIGVPRTDDVRSNVWTRTPTHRRRASRDGLLPGWGARAGVTARARLKAPQWLAIPCMDELP